jgi:hypothetical protein
VFWPGPLPDRSGTGQLRPAKRKRLGPKDRQAALIFGATLEGTAAARHADRRAVAMMPSLRADRVWSPKHGRCPRLHAPARADTFAGFRSPSCCTHNRLVASSSPTSHKLMEFEKSRLEGDRYFFYEFSRRYTHTLRPLYCFARSRASVPLFFPHGPSLLHHSDIFYPQIHFRKEPVHPRSAMRIWKMQLL